MTEENSDDDFQSTITRKRKGRKPTPVNSSQKQMKKGKEKSSSSSSTAIVESKSSDDAPLTKPTAATAKYNTVSDSNNSSANANIVKKCAIAVKATVKPIWKPNYTQALHELVNITNTQELEEDFNFDLSDYIRKEFFVEIFLSPIVRNNISGRLLGKTANYRSLVSKHKESYCLSASYTPIVLVNAQQIALYECTKVQTAYLNNIKAHFGNRLRAILNKVCKTKELAADLRKDLKKKNVDKRAVNKALREEVYGPCNQKKSKAVLQSYLNNYKFKKDSIFYDVKSNTECHYMAFMKIAELFDSEGLRQFSCFPLRTTSIPCYMTLDFKIVHCNVLKNKTAPKMDNKFQNWGSVVNTNNKAFKDQGMNISLCFQDTIETDGVGASIIKQNTTINRKMAQPKTKYKESEDVARYMESLIQEELNEAKSMCVLMDSERRDLLHCMETSTAQNKQVMVYTKMTRTKVSSHYRILQKKTKPASVKSSEAKLAKTKSSSVKIEEYETYIKTRASVEKVLCSYYGNETLQTKQTYFSNHCFDFHLKNKADLYFGHLGYFPQPNESTGIDMHATYLELMIKQRHISERLDNGGKAKLLGIVAKMSKESSDQDSLKQQASQILEKLQVLPFRKMKFSSKLYYDQDDLMLVKKLKQKFGSDAVLVLGNWPAPDTKYQELTRNKGLIQMLKEDGSVVFLIDEFRTSSFCPLCEGRLENFKTLRNPRPYKKKTRPTVLCHGLQRCIFSGCLEQLKPKLWNRDLAAVLNFKKILTC
ncbi:hypothetical protein BCV72DRAFT_321325 [Rhizopus microsporus var. microsporus]|uniref:Uncharacterized protein n=1 Tax=Rhizopus microsporus var. microsporus TaxID=86635 RepID=A0A1X0RAM9_RHIZD|nr:hypothetical protein BCV72DRAFT_321325 [Rhizopus microsporus var. microsporus]